MIAFRGFEKRYGEVRGVDSLTLDVARGEAVALLGPNGSGKTTSLKAAAGLLRPSAGEVLLDGRPAWEPEARRAISFLPQRVSFPEALTGRETVEFYRALRGARHERVEQVLRFASLNGAGARPVGTYSGGMVQRLGLAVTMLPDAPVLLLDEPTAALDPDGLCAFYGVVQRHRNDGKTILFTSHQLGDVERIADRIAVLVEGKLVAALTASEMAERLADAGTLRVRVAGAVKALVAAARPLAPGTFVQNDEIVIPGPARLRPRILDVLRAAGAEVLTIRTEEGRLDALYRELVKERS